MSEHEYFSMEYPTLNESLHYRHFQNGFTAYVVVKKGFSSIYTSVGTHFGSVHNQFRMSEKQELPDGLAHFLEHKMFESAEGNLLQRFSMLGASPNAYTSFNKTVYLFSCTDEFSQCLQLLLELLKQPLFTDENIQKEQGIIGQEIDMCNDDPDRRLYFNLLRCLYVKNPVRNEIAGSKESIAKINKELLTLCHSVFYNPEQLQMVVVGDVDPNQVFSEVEKGLGENSKRNKPVSIIRAKEPEGINEKLIVEQMDITMPRVMLGFKDHVKDCSGAEGLKREIAIEIMLDCVFGKSSDWYKRAYKRHLISDAFGTEYAIQEDYAYAILDGETDYPDELVEDILKAIKETKRRGVDEESFLRARKVKKGHFLRMMDSPRSVAAYFLEYLYKGVLLFDYADIYDRIEIDFAHECFNEVFNEDYMAISRIDGIKN